MSTNSFQEALANAKPFVARKPTLKPKNGKGGSSNETASVVTENKPVAKLSLRDRLTQTITNVQSASELKNKLNDARECQTEPDIIRSFVELVERSDVLALFIYGQTMTDEKARGRWEEMDWDEQEAQLKEWANGGNENASAILLGLADFNENSLLREFLRRIFVDFFSPLKWINTWGGMRKFLDDLVEQDMALAITKPNRIPENGIVIPSLPTGVTLYIPIRGVKVAEGGWMFVKEAAARTKVNEDELAKLKEEETNGLTVYKVSHGEQGQLFVRLGGRQAVLLDAFKEGSFMTVRVIKAVGLSEDLWPKETLWDENANRPTDNGHWKWINESLGRVAETHQRNIERGRREIREKTDPLTKLATVGFRFEDQGLTRLIQGENETVAIWNAKFRWGPKDSPKEGFFGVALNRDGENFILREVVSSFMFPKTKLVGQNLPLVWDASIPEIKLRTLSQTDKDVFVGLKMVEILLKLRLGAELRVAVPKQPAG